MRTWQVGDVMTREVETVVAETPYREIVDVLLRHGVSAVPVIDDFRRVLGVVSEADLLHRVERAGDPALRRVFESRRRRGARGKSAALLAGDLMTAPAVTTDPEATLSAAARLMDREQVKRLPCWTTWAGWSGSSVVPTCCGCTCGRTPRFGRTWSRRCSAGCSPCGMDWSRSRSATVT
ncbi:CBS domain-containing protein [Micromonospora saelicesensis]|uniref:CBS domain-containing protein n=1 Tax=Micromonospora saelicesensis TaxID=285676 RepID=UPI001FCA162D|nr:CBS domain-containing protein [Micromonospora saelicesensis]